LTTALVADEIVLEASIPEMPSRSGWSFTEFARRFGDFAIVGVAVLLVPEKDRIVDARIALTGVADKPWRERKLEAKLIGEKGKGDLFAAVAAEIAAGIEPGSDIHASETYRRSLADVLTRRALAQAWHRAQGGN
jgi:carbon-monoxide dehydrogenase medium subunit